MYSGTNKFRFMPREGHFGDKMFLRNSTFNDYGINTHTLET